LGDFLNNLLHLNPGAIGKFGMQKTRTMLRFEIDRGTIQNMEIVNLKKENERSGCKDNNGAVSVIAYSQDEKQLLLGFGCGNTLARMFAVKKDDGWKAISPTNQFNLFEVPSCKMTDENNISKEIAPVCQNESRAAENAPLTYSCRVR